jgi:ABC-type branched-subunit amino acid transport system substrate-binding protein
MSGGSSGRNKFANTIGTLFAIIVVLSLIVGYSIASPNNQPKDFLCKTTHIKFFCRGIVDVQTVMVRGNSLSIGLSDGNYAFDANGPDGTYKQQGVQAFNNGDINTAIDDWNQAISITTDDAESMIYIENAHVLSSGLPYVTIVVATTLGQTLGSGGLAADIGTSLEVGQDDLRGVYLAQRDFNQKHANLKMRVLIANLGVKSSDYLNAAENVALQKIIRLAYTDDTFVGVIGFPFSFAAKIAIPILSASHIPIISPSASSTDLTNKPDFFRVIPSDADQGRNAAQFASQMFNAHRVAVLNDSTNPYSKSLANSFTSSFTGLGSDYVVVPESFHLSNADSLDAVLNNLLSQSPPVDMIYLAGYSDDLNNLKIKLKDNNVSFPIMGGDAFYEFGGYTSGDYSDFYFTAFTFPDLWNILCANEAKCASPSPDVTDATQYSRIFDPKGIHRGNYGYDRPGPHVWQSYDAASTLMKAVDDVQGSGQSLSLSAIDNELPNVSFQGVTGLISFANGSSDPVNKTVVMLCIDSHYHTHVVRVYGQFAPGTQRYAPDINTIRHNICA